MAELINQPEDCDETRFRRALGRQLRACRQVHGWTRREMVARMSRPVSLRALESYESGSREPSVYRYWSLCGVLGVDPQVPIRAAVTQLGVADPAAVCTDLRAIVTDRSEDLIPLRAWARLQLCTLPAEGAGIAYLSPAAVPPLAALCGLRAEVLVRRIRMLSASDEQGGSPS